MILGWKATSCGYTNCSNMSKHTGPVTVGSQKKRTDRWSCLSLDRTKRSISTAGRKKLIEPEPNWFSIRCNSPMHSSVISSRHSKPPFVHVASESPFYFIFYFCDCCNVMTQQSNSNKLNNKFFEFLFLLVKVSFHKSAYTGWSKKTPTTLSILCRTANWSLFKKEPMSGNTWCGHSRTSKLENWCYNWLQFVLVS